MAIVYRHYKPICLCGMWVASISALSIGQEPLETIELDPILANAHRIEPIGVGALPDYRLQLPAPIEFPTALDLSDSLQSSPTFAAFRRTANQAAHPTTQGVRLRNLGASATSRALVLHDGVPQNDPFGGWVYWHQYNLSQIENITIMPSGGGAAWGNFGSGGTISLISARPVPGSAQASLMAGTSGAYSFNGSMAQALGQRAAFDLGWRHFRSDGFHTLDPSQRGPIDQRAYSEADSFQGRLQFDPTEQWSAQIALKAFEEQRGNGTPYARNDTEAINLSAVAQRQIDQSSVLNIALYRQERDFRNTFSSVSPDRASESPALDQYDVPADAYGAAVSYRRSFDNGDFALAGVDFRQTEGSINESFRYMGGQFTRDRYAGGEQSFIGAFGTYARSLGDRDRATLTLRADRISDRRASRREIDTTTGATLLDERYPNRSDEEISFNFAWRREITDTLSSHLSVFRGFRAPTLNELYRPFRVRNDITEANPGLTSERQHGVELAIVAENAQRYRFSAAAFHYEIDGMITNALITTESGNHPLFGFIPPGGSGSQRHNLDKTSVSGIELQATWQPLPALRVDASTTYAYSKIERDRAFPEFAGKAFPQSAPWRANLALEWAPGDRFSIHARGEYSDRAYENLDNALRIPSGTRFAVGANYRFDPNHSISFTVENVFDTTIVSGISNDGLITIDAPREARLAYTWRR